MVLVMGIGMVGVRMRHRLVTVQVGMCSTCLYKLAMDVLAMHDASSKDTLF